MNHEGLIHSPVGVAMTIGGGVIAQVTPTTSVGAAGLIMSLSGLLVAGFQYYKVWMDSRQRDAQIVALQRELGDANEKRHKMRDDFNARNLKLYNDLHDVNMRNAWLEGQLGIMDKTHSEAINVISEDVATIAGSLNPPIDVQSAHLQPLAGSDDDLQVGGK